MTDEALPAWKVKALQDPNVSERHARIVMDGPKSLSEAWVLSAMRLKYQILGLSLIHISSPRDLSTSRMPSSA